ncbi:hypothetical protein EC9_46970 [Rosistilla ulvae]|uniref:Uncharacterized protein n=1 Tax=Rosistilla ulvae TaxID=1930277 RepID=A0A517M6H6_9BACT|nr:hypothetical protein [Rosistilla ulvae]QDS90488.1 hypothetical protein EC9_46970 [Rosistilla ulvae]
MFPKPQLSVFLILAILSVASGCHCFPSIRYRDPHAADYETACSCGSGDCLECRDREEKTKKVPWPLFHSVPTRPVFEGNPAQQMVPYCEPQNDVLLPPLRPVPPPETAEAIDPPLDMQEETPPGINYSV